MPSEDLPSLESTDSQMSSPEASSLADSPHSGQTGSDTTSSSMEYSIPPNLKPIELPKHLTIIDMLVRYY